MISLALYDSWGLFNEKIQLEKVILLTPGALSTVPGKNKRKKQIEQIEKKRGKKPKSKHIEQNPQTHRKQIQKTISKKQKLVSRESTCANKLG